MIDPRAAAVVALGLIGTPALANAVLPLEGIFGNESGCDYFMTGEPGSGDLLLLTPDTLTIHKTGCYFETLIGQSDYSYAIRALCRAEDEEAGTRITVGVFDLAEDGVIVSLVGLRVFGPILPCPGTDGLLRRGVQI